MNILLTSVGRRTYLINYFKDALQGNGLVHASNSVLTYSLEKADKYILTPQIYDEGYIDFLLDYCLNNDISVIISLFDIDLPVLSKNKSIFKSKGINVIVSDERVTRICNDKWATYNFLKGIGLKQPRSFISLEVVRNAMTNEEINYPLFIKPRWGMGSIGIYQVDNDKELDILYEKLHRQIFSTYLKYESKEDTASCILIQEKLDGKEYGLDVLNDLKGNYVTTIAKEKLAMRAGETDIAEIVENDLFIETAIKISHNLRHIANLDVDCFKLKDGSIVVLEMNCRFGGQYPFSHIAGVDFPKQILEWIEGKSTKSQLVVPVIGIRSCKDLVPVRMIY